MITHEHATIVLCAKILDSGQKHLSVLFTPFCSLLMCKILKSVAFKQRWDSLLWQKQIRHKYYTLQLKASRCLNESPGSGNYTCPTLKSLTHGTLISTNTHCLCKCLSPSDVKQFTSCWLSPHHRVLGVERERLHNCLHVIWRNWGPNKMCSHLWVTHCPCRAKMSYSEF